MGLLRLNPAWIWHESGCHLSLKFATQHIPADGFLGLASVEAYCNGDAVKFLDIFGIKDTTTDTGRYSLRWPGHAEFWKKMVGLGFLSDEPVLVNGHEI